MRLNRYFVLLIFFRMSNQILIILIRFGIGHTFMYNLVNGFCHLYRMSALENVAAHVNAVRSLGNYIVSQMQGIFFRNLLSACHNNRNRACSDNFIKVFAVIRLNHLNSHLSHNAGSQLEEPRCPLSDSS